MAFASKKSGGAGFIASGSTPKDSAYGILMTSPAFSSAVTFVLFAAAISSGHTSPNLHAML
jgi:hypothetical protein